MDSRVGGLLAPRRRRPGREAQRPDGTHIPTRRSRLQTAQGPVARYVRLVRGCSPGVVVIALLAGGPARPLPAASQAIASPVATPLAAGCTVPPRSVAEVAAIVAAAAPDQSTPRPATPNRQPEPSGPGTPIAVPHPLPIVLPAGTPAPASIAAAVAATLRQFVACVNAGEPLRMMALVSDELLRDGFAGVPMTEEAIAAYVTPSRPLPPEERHAIVAIRDVRTLDDRHVAALLDWNRPLGPAPERIQTDYVVLIPQGAGWVIDFYVANVGDRSRG